MGPRVARRMHDSNQREDRCGLCGLDNLKRRVNARPPRRRPVRQDCFSDSLPPGGEESSAREYDSADVQRRIGCGLEC